jgi:hypothetical protein
MGAVSGRVATDESAPQNTVPTDLARFFALD